MSVKRGPGRSTPYNPALLTTTYTCYQSIHFGCNQTTYVARRKLTIVMVSCYINDCYVQKSDIFQQKQTPHL